ncbi:MAG: hypothetical protein COT74_03960 [Bdellovibrionales bacterium CG10_big_fil_rev_8_21_14_0_10_45_34]|nr:MAG: hypothetical protein COT74_03960 [Bdellovibrionales bacterium CG10_big_fil_rev_8_21_14_0_10_45_34]
MFKRDHHIRIAAILQALDADLLRQHQCYFGGGTAIVLSRNEYRESVDIDFLISDLDHYRLLRQLITGSKGISAIVREGFSLVPLREIRADQYGVRTMLQVAQAEIKFEIIHEGRIELEPPSPANRICGVSTLTLIDMAASKLLANSDRWADDSVFSRDVIDLAMLDLPRAKLSAAIKKAKAAYGESVERDLLRAIDKLRERVDRLDDCMDALQMNQVPKALLWQKIRKLKP